MLRNDNFVQQLGVLYGLNQAYGISSAFDEVFATEFFATLNGGSANSATLYSNTVTLLSSEYEQGEAIRRRHVLTLDRLQQRAPLADEVTAAVHAQETLCRMSRSEGVRLYLLPRQ
jgi:hypothetical protein